MTDLVPLYLLLLVGSVRSSTPVPQIPVCEDQLTDCESYGATACQKVYINWTRQNCRKYCGLCGSGEKPVTHHPIPSVGTCHDALTTCTDYGQDMCQQFSTWAFQHCASYCGFCADVTTTQRPSGFLGCKYRDHVYTTGEMWQDGCQYHCQCLDGSTGKYRCTQVCATWNLPPVCHLNDPAPGKCCKTPSCPFLFNYPPGYTES